MTTKSTIVDAIVAQTGLKKKDAEAAATTFIAALEGALASGDRIQLTGFGTFEVKERAARTGRNPHTGEEITIPASKHVSFTAGKSLKESVNK